MTLRFAFALLIGLIIGAGTLSSATHPASAAGKATASPSSEATAPPTPEPPDKAIPRLEAKLKTSPTDREALSEITSYYLQVNRPDLALQTSQKLLSLGVKTGQVYYFSGYANLLLGRIPQATSDLENASNLEPTNLTVLATLSDLYGRQNRFADAERIAKRALTFNKDDKRAYITYGRVLAAEQKFDDARTQYEAAAKLDPKDVEPIIAEASTYLSQGSVALALSLYDRALGIDPNSVDALYGKARILANQHNVKDAVATYEKLRGILPDADGKAAILTEEAQLYAAEKMDDQADATFKSVIAQYPSARQDHVAYGDYLAAKKDLTAAEAEWQIAVGPNRDNRDALGRLGTLYADKKDFTKAQEYLKRLAEIAPDDPRSFQVLGSVYAEQKNWKEAHDSFRRAYDLTHSPDMLVAVGETDINLRNYKEAQQIFEAVEKAAQDYVKQDPRVVFLLGQVYQKQGMDPQAKGAYQRFLAYLKPGSQPYAQVKKLIDDIDRRGKPAATAPPKKP